VEYQNEDLHLEFQTKCNPIFILDDYNKRIKLLSSPGASIRSLPNIPLRTLQQNVDSLYLLYYVRDDLSITTFFDKKGWVKGVNNAQMVWAYNRWSYYHAMNEELVAEEIVKLWSSLEELRWY